MVVVWGLPTFYFWTRYKARRWKMSAIISAVFAWCLVLGVNALGFFPRGSGWVVVLVGLALGALVDAAIVDDMRRKRADAASSDDVVSK